MVNVTMVALGLVAGVCSGEGKEGERGGEQKCWKT